MQLDIEKVTQPGKVTPSGTLTLESGPFTHPYSWRESLELLEPLKRKPPGPDTITYHYIPLHPHVSAMLDFDATFRVKLL
jgi:hypothetical protein